MQRYAEKLTQGFREYGGTYSWAPALRYFVDRLEILIAYINYAENIRNPGKMRITSLT